MSKQKEIYLHFDTAYGDIFSHTKVNDDDVRVVEYSAIEARDEKIKSLESQVKLLKENQRIYSERKTKELSILQQLNTKLKQKHFKLLGQYKKALATIKKQQGELPND